MEAAPGFGPGMMDLQSTALPLGYAATKESIAFILKRVKKYSPLFCRIQNGSDFWLQPEYR